MQIIPHLEVFKPKTPFLCSVHSENIIDRKVVIRGKITEERVIINLQSGPYCEEDDIPLHISIWLHAEVIVLNTLNEEGWCTEVLPEVWPLQEDASFDVQISVKLNAYSIKVNGRHLCDFPHRLPLSAVKFVYVNEGAKVDFIGVE